MEDCNSAYTLNISLINLSASFSALLEDSRVQSLFKSLPQKENEHLNTFKNELNTGKLSTYEVIYAVYKIFWIINLKLKIEGPHALSDRIIEDIDVLRVNTSILVK